MGRRERLRWRRRGRGEAAGDNGDDGSSKRKITVGEERTESTAFGLRRIRR